jgi:cyclophilin family peptidyl-prolyl cis-trans isomerase
MKANIFNTLIIISLVLFSCKGNKGTQQQENKLETKDTVKMTATLAFDPSTLGEEPVFDINTTIGTIRVKLYKETPKHRDNFVKLASEHFYDNILFHRVINGFMIQAGDPLTKDTLNADKFGTGGPGYTIPAEITPKFKHKKGALAAARRGDASNPAKESSGSQFYIVQDPKACSQLDGQYTIFGETVSGLDVIDKIAATPTDKRDRPLTDIRILSIVPVIENKPAAK